MAARAEPADPRVTIYDNPGATIRHEIGKRSKCAFQYASQMTSVSYLRKNQYKTCPNIEVAQMKDSIIVLCLDGKKAGSISRVELLLFEVHQNLQLDRNRLAIQ
jgi:hypothetical protein